MGLRASLVSTIILVRVCVRLKRSCSLSLGSDDGDHLVPLSVGTALGTESLASKLDSELLLLLVTSSNHFQHLALVWGEAGDFVDDTADGSNSGVELALAV